MKRTILAVVCTSVLTALIMGQAKNPVPKVIKAERFELLDAAGVLRAVLMTMPDGGARLLMQGSGGGSVVLVVTAQGGSQIMARSGDFQSILHADRQAAKVDIRSSDFIASMSVLTAPNRAGVIRVMDKKDVRNVTIMTTDTDASICVDGPDGPLQVVAFAPLQVGQLVRL